ncbi:MAG: hypothetical protein OXH70_01985 [Acidobacteria bacterium]|nr:hypothetical protein [Acidobacteriota bacterium]MCY3971601.1 hypothetical protein [Acidobacteriota bacterium]
MNAEVPPLGTGTGPAAHVVAVLVLLSPFLVYLGAPCPDRPLDAAQQAWARVTGRNKDH